MPLTGYQRSAISNALRIAAGLYAQNARELRRVTNSTPVPVANDDSDPNFISLGPIPREACERLAQQFDLQNKEALELAEQMEFETE